jgi:Family of unknown function (DUF6069)
MKNLNYIEIAKRAGIIYLGATITNALLYIIGQKALGLSYAGSQFASYSLVQLFVSSLVFTLLGVIGFVLCHQFYKQNPHLAFKVLGYIFIVVMAFPLAVSDASLIGKLYFELGHLILGVSFIEFMTRGTHRH